MLDRNSTRSLGQASHPEIHVVAGCVVTGTEGDGRETVDRVAVGQLPTFWSHYRVAADGRQLWLADYGDRDAALAAVRMHAGRAPIYVEDNGTLTVASPRRCRGQV